MLIIVHFVIGCDNWHQLMDINHDQKKYRFFFLCEQFFLSLIALARVVLSFAWVIGNIHRPLKRIVYFHTCCLVKFDHCMYAFPLLLSISLWNMKHIASGWFSQCMEVTCASISFFSQYFIIICRCYTQCKQGFAQSRTTFSWIGGLNITAFSSFSSAGW